MFKIKFPVGLQSGSDVLCQRSWRVTCSKNADGILDYDPYIEAERDERLCTQRTRAKKL